MYSSQEKLGVCKTPSNLSLALQIKNVMLISQGLKN